MGVVLKHKPENSENVHPTPMASNNSCKTETPTAATKHLTMLTAAEAVEG